MADFMDEEAVESSEEDMSEDENRTKTKSPSSKKRQSKMISSDEEEEEDDEEKAKEEMRGFIADDDEDSGGHSSRSGSGSGSESGGESRKKHKKKKRNKRRHDEEIDEIDEEDLALMEENLGIKIKKQRRRIRMDSDDDEPDETGTEDGGRSGRRERSDDLPDIQGGEGADDSGSDDVDDFIVDEEGRPMKKDRKKKHHIFSDSARQAAEDIFGVAFDYDDFEGYGEDEEEDEEEEDEYDSDMDADLDDEERQRKRDKKKGRKKKKPAKSIFELYEPKELELRHFTDLDNEIRTTDMPERMQLRSTPVTSVPEGAEEELDREAEWIFRHGFSKATISQQGEFNDEDCSEWKRKETGTVEKIRKTLDFMRQQFNEVPFIAFYRKEYIRPELQINDLWRVYHFDELWCKLQTRKRNLKQLYQNMLAYQGEIICAEPDAPIPEGIRVLTNDDLNNVDLIETFEELKDRDQHFKLYYSRDMEGMQEYTKKQKREAKEAKRRMRNDRRKITKTIENEETGEQEEVTDEEAMAAQDNELDDEDFDDKEEEPDQDILKKAKANDPYNLCIKYNLSGMVPRFGLSAENFGENLKDGYQKVDVDGDPSEPLEAAQEYVNKKFSKPEDVITAAKFMVATQISRDPSIRKEVREAFYERATITVKPTKKGMKEIDENHECYALKYLKDKPIQTLKNDDWLKLTQAEDQKCVTIELANDIKGMSANSTYLEEAKDLFQQDLHSKLVQEWNALRASCVEMAFKKMLYPMLRKELRIKLTTEAKEGVLRKCKEKLYDWIKIGKYSVKFEDEDEDEWDSSKGCRVMGIVYENDRDIAAYAVVISGEGEVIQFIKLDNITKGNRNPESDDSIKKQNDLETLKKFIVKNRPHVVAIGAADRKAIDIRNDVTEILNELNTNDQFQFPQINCFLMDDNLAKVYANSERANQDFREYPNVLRQAVSIARRMQDPLIEFSQLTGPENEIASLRYHPMQDCLSEEDLLEGLTTEFINRTNEVGVDINECVAHPYMSNLVQFVGGLGPRKGAWLLKTLRQMQSSQRLENRQQLVTLCHMGPKVLINCAGFIKIDTSSLGDSEVYVEVLDGSRIHNEAYEWARKMAVDALEYDEEEGNPANALEEILNEPEKLSELDLDAFATELERQGFGKKSITLCDIRSELCSMYKDLRTPYSPPDEEEVFNLTTKETPETFWPGKLVLAQVTGFQYQKPTADDLDSAAPKRVEDGNTWQCPFCGQDDFPELTEVWNHFDAGTCPGKSKGIRIRLDNGVTGFIKLEDLSDSAVISPEQRVTIRQSIYCRITQIKPDRFAVDAACKTSVLEDKDGEWKPKKDDYYDHEAAFKDEEKEVDKKQQKQRQAYTKRVIVHPSFYNIGYKEAEENMKNMDQGEVIIRPSSKGEDRLTVTWKVHDNIYHHIDVKEQNKLNTFSLGQSLWIGNEEFEDLDEIIARHINPMAAHARDILNFKYYKDTQGGKREVAEEILRTEKKAYPGKIHYLLSPSKELPGKFIMSYMPRQRARHEYVTVTPDGFRFRKINFETLGNLMKWFKEHFRDPIPGTPITPGRMTNRTPYMSSNNTPSGGGGITPGAMSMAAGTPYGHTPVGGYGNINTPYTPSGQTPILTPYNTPGPSMTPRAASGSNTPQQGGHHRVPGQRPLSQGVFGFDSGAKNATPRGGFGQPGHTPVMTPFNTPGPSSRSIGPSPRDTPSRSQITGSHQRPAHERSYYASRGQSNGTPRGSYTPSQDAYRNRKDTDRRGERSSSSRDDRDRRKDRIDGGSFGSTGKRTPKGNAYGDATPLYDENI